MNYDDLEEEEEELKQQEIFFNKKEETMQNDKMPDEWYANPVNGMYMAGVWSVIYKHELNAEGPLDIETIPIEN